MMITKHIKPLIITVFVLTIILLAFQLLRNELAFHRNLISEGEWWRLISGNLTHSNYPHLFLNLAGLWIFTFLFIDTLKAKTFIFWTLFLCIFVGGGLFLFNPELAKYYGFSGVLYGLFICAASNLILQKDYFTGASILLLIIAKVSWDQVNGGNASSEELIGIPVAIDAHLYGLIGATALCAFCIFRHIPKK